MKKNVLVLVFLMLLVALLTAQCTPQTIEVEKIVEVEKVVEVEKEVMVEVTAVPEEEPETETTEEPQYGGSMTFYWWGQEVPSADIVDNNWVTRMYNSGVLERLAMPNFEEYGVRGNGEFTNFNTHGIPLKYVTGALAESWEISETQMVFHLRRGIMWAAEGKEHVMETREFTAHDAVFALTRRADMFNGSLWADNGGYIESIHAEDDYTLVVQQSRFNRNAFTDIALDPFSVIYPPEVVEAGSERWENMVGTGPFMVGEAEVGSAITFVRNPLYWGTTTIDGVEYQLPFLDELVMPILPDEATQIAALRTGQIDLMGTVTVNYHYTLAQTSDELTESGWVEIWPVVVALNTNNEYLSNKLVRQALMLAVDQDAIIDSVWGFGAVYNWPVDFHSGSVIGTPADLPEHISNLYQYDPDGARELLAEAGYADGFDLEIAFSTQATAGTHGDVATLLNSYLGDIGINLVLKAMDNTALSSIRDARTGYDLLITNSTSVNPLGVFSGLANQDPDNTSNTPNYNNSEFNALDALTDETADLAELDRLAAEMALIVMEDAIYIPIGASGRLAYNWPWVKNYYGEAMEGGTNYGPFLSTIWIDEQLKDELGY